MIKQLFSLVKHLFTLKPIITTLFYNKDNIVTPIEKGILQISENTLFALIALIALKQIRTTMFHDKDNIVDPVITNKWSSTYLH